MNPIEAIIILFVVVGFVIGVILMFSSVFGLDTVNDTFNIDTILSKAPISFADAGSYELTDNDQLDLEVCFDYWMNKTNPEISKSNQSDAIINCEKIVYSLVENGTCLLFYKFRAHLFTLSQSL